MTGFGRSNSLSINTSGSLFGNNPNANQGQQSAGLFGSSTNPSSQQPAPTGGLFGSASQPQSGGLFGGAPAPAASQPPQTGSLFGGTQPASQPQSGSLFGNLNKPAATGTNTGLFGSSATASQPQQGGGLFGGALGGNAQNQVQNPQSGGLFNTGQPSKPSLFGASTTQQTTTPSLFGNTNTQQAQTSTPSLFGSTQQTQPQQQGSLFGGMASQRGPGQSAVQIQSIDLIKGTTRFSDLHPDIQNKIQEQDDSIQGHISDANRVRETLPGSGDKIATLGPDVAMIENFMSTVEAGLENDSANIAQLKAMINKDADEAALVFRAVENQKLPSQFHYGNRSNLNASSANARGAASLDDNNDPTKPVDLMGYFSKRTDELSGTLDVYQRQMREIEAHLRTMEAGTVEKAQQLAGSRNGARDQRRELVEAMKAIEGAILDAAKKVGQTRDMVTQRTLGNVGGA